MIKGCSRKVIVIKNTGSNMFEEAYFIINPKETARKDGDFLTEANRIIAQRAGVRPFGQKKSGFIPSLMLVLSGFTLGLSLAFAISLILT